jgi:ribose 5-phosphate isomerase B
MRIAIGCDHRGFAVKDIVKKTILDLGHNFEDFGCDSQDPVDYPDIAVKVAGAVAKQELELGILVCGTGIGMCITANKVRGIRAASCHNAFTARRARQHNDANICCLAAEEGKAQISSIVETFISTHFEDGRHQKRLDKIKEIEDRCGKPE